MTQREKDAYFAGIIDGEGFITCGLTQGIRRNGTPWKHWYFRIGVQMTCYEILRWIQENYGGHIYQRNTIGRLGKKPFWIWQETKKENLHKIVNVISPYLILKGRQAQLILEYYKDFVRLCGNYIKQEIRIQEWERRLKIKAKLNQLNK